MNMNNGTPQTAGSIPAGYAYYQPQAPASSTKGASLSPSIPTSTPYKVIDIGTQFCKQYYKMLSVEPEAGYKFYSKHSYLTHGQEGDLDAPICFGLEDIQQRILTMGFSGCRVFISTIDCQASLQGGVIVVVLGRMQMKGGLSKKFTQSIYLAEQPTGFFVLNDVFRFIDTDEVQSPIQLSNVQSTTNQSIQPILHQSLPVSQPTMAPISPPPSLPAQTPVQGSGKPQLSQKTETASWGDSTWTVESSLAAPISPAKPAVAASATQSIKIAVKKEDKSALIAEALENASTSWAEITSGQQSKWGNGVVSEAKGTSVAAALNEIKGNEMKTSSETRSSEIRSPEIRSEPRHFKIRRNNEPVKSESPQAPLQPSSQEPPQSPQQQPQLNEYRPRRRYNENYNVDASLFVGQVKKRMEESAIREAFSTFGEIKCVEVASDCFFVEFTEVEPAQQAIKAGTVKVGGHDVKVDKRRPPRPYYHNRNFRPKTSSETEQK